MESSIRQISVCIISKDEEAISSIKEALNYVITFRAKVVCSEDLEDSTLSQIQPTPDIVLLDFTLGESFEKFGLLKVQEAYPLVPVLFLSDSLDMDKAIKAVQEGGYDCLVKNTINPQMLERIIRYSVERNKLERLRDEVMHMVAHDIKNPIAIIRESVSLMVDGIVQGEQTKEYLQVVLDEMDRLTRLTEAILDISKLESGQMKLEKEKLDGVQFCKDVLAKFAPRVQATDVELKSECPEHTVMLEVDVDKMTQALLNLLGNAAKFTEKGWIQLGVYDQKDKLKLCVQDTGEGMSPERLKNLFNRFQSSEESKTSEEKGTGLGLSICKGIVDLHDGTIEVESILGEGTTFSILLPK